MKTAKEYTNAFMDHAEWLKQKDAFLWNENNGDLEFYGKENIFLVEKRHISVFDQGDPHFNVMV